MAEPNPTAPALKHADGTAVTAQEAYDAFMNSRVLIVGNKITHEVVNMLWYDNNSSQDDPTNVGYVRLYYMTENSSGALDLAAIHIGKSSLVPK